MNDQIGVASHAGALLRPMSSGSRGAIQRGWEPAPRRISKKESLRAGAFLMFYLAAYLAAGFACVTFMQWAWMQAFG